MERKVSFPEYSDSSEIVSDLETESDFVPPSPLSPLPLTLSEEKRVEQCTRIGLVATHKCSSDILTEDDRREMTAIRASLGMLPRQNEVTVRNRDHCDEQEEREDSFQDQQEVREDEDNSHDSTSQLKVNNIREKLTEASKTEISNQDVQISTQQCELQLDKGQIFRENLPVVSRHSPIPSRGGNRAETLTSVHWRGEKDSASEDERKLDEHKSNIERKITCEDGRRCSIRDRERQQAVGLHRLTADKEWSEETDKYCQGDRPLDFCRCRRSGTTVKCRGLQRGSKVCSYSKHCIPPNKLMPVRPNVYSARSSVARSDWLLCALCRNQFRIRREDMFYNSSLFRVLTQSFMPQACRPRVYYNSTALPLATLHSFPCMRTCHKPTSQSPRGSYFQQYMMKKRQSTDWRFPSLNSSLPPQPSSLHRGAVGQPLRYSTVHARPPHLSGPLPPLPVARTKGCITSHKTYTDARSPKTYTDARSPKTYTDARSPKTYTDARSHKTYTDARSHKHSRCL